MFYSKIRQFCVKNDLFTCGDAKQYDTMFEMAENVNVSNHDVALVIWICSIHSDLSFERIEEEIAKIRVFADEAEEAEEPYDIDSDFGFDPFMGCSTFDC